MPTVDPFVNPELNRNVKIILESFFWSNLWWGKYQHHKWMTTYEKIYFHLLDICFNFDGSSRTCHQYLIRH